MGASFTHGALTFTLGIGVSPVSANSESPSGKPLAESTICRHTGRVTALKQNSPVARTFFTVCFSLPSGLRMTVSEIIGGTTHTTVKKENGARLATPFAFTVDAQPIGRGTTEPMSRR